MPSKPEIRIGTGAFTAAGWERSFYPKGMRLRQSSCFRNCTTKKNKRGIECQSVND